MCPGTGHQQPSTSVCFTRPGMFSSCPAHPERELLVITHKLPRAKGGTWRLENSTKWWGGGWGVATKSTVLGAALPLSHRVTGKSFFPLS